MREPGPMMLNKLKWSCQWAVMALIFAACSANLPAVSTSQPTNVPTTADTARLSSFPTSEPTTISQPTKTVAKRPVATSIPPSPTARFSVRAHEIEDVDNGHHVETALWSDDEKFIYYAVYAVSTENRELQWAAYDVATHLTQTVHSPLKYDFRVWKQLGVPPPRPLDSSVELRGHVSPSGKRIIYTVGYGSNDPYTTPEPNVRSRTEIWVADSNGKRKTKLKEFPGSGAGVITHAAWFNGESEVLFDLYYEYGVHFYIADMATLSVVSLADVSEFKSGTETYWAVSPDGSTLAVVDFGGTLWLVSLNDGKSVAVEKHANMPYWSKHSDLLYYWWGPEFLHEAALRVYDTASKKISDVVDVPSLDSQGVPITYFAVSPQGDKIAFWNGDLWLVELPK